MLYLRIKLTMDLKLVKELFYEIPISPLILRSY